MALPVSQPLGPSLDAEVQTNKLAWLQNLLQQEQPMIIQATEQRENQINNTPQMIKLITISEISSFA